MQLLTTTMVGSAFYPKLNAGTSYLFDDDKQGKPKPVFIAPGAGDKGRFGGANITFKLDKSQTSGNLGSSEIILQAGHLGAPPHHHKGFDEICIVQEGVLNILVGEEVFEVKAGGWHLRPRGITHTFWNSGTTPAKFIELYSPAGHEAYMKALAKLFEDGKKPQPDDLAKLADKYDIVFEFEKLKGIMDKYKVHL
ncbi:cupin domain-containing protein [Pedobacter sp. KR3-3]|uniref:Cupin domain-containing protein n=1 Tax=Pedobacter albus TaxID=3113905 RepID=A0ABU7I932_9SPHI|nr:cupin domain-containing protein [Pedobacter sp. KR3-3]MEE1945975.1 cupin domain-containing protein [Pedobacter sp. KR3-3]